MVKYGEADLIVSGLNNMGAKIPLFAKAALKSRKRFGGGVLQPTHYIKATYSDLSKSFRNHSYSIETNKQQQDISLQTSVPFQKMHYLREATLQRDFGKIRTSYQRLELGLYMLQWVDHFCREGLFENAQVFHLLGNALTSLETSQNLQRLRMFFELRLLKIQGVLEESHAIQDILSQTIAQHADLPLKPNVEAHIKKIIRERLLSSI